MKRNQAEIDRATIMFLSKRLPNVSEETMRFFTEPFEHTLAFKKVGKRAEQADTLWCAHCGGTFNRSELTDIHENPKYDKKDLFGDNRRYIATCPHCGKPMHIINWKYRERKLEDVVGVHTFMGEWSIDRYFISTCYCKVGEREDVHVQEIGQRWERRDGKAYNWCCRVGGFYWNKFWRWYAPWHFSEESPACDTWRTETEQYDMPTDFSLDEELVKRGISLDALHGLKLTQIIQYMAEDCHFETLWKQGDWEIAKFFKKDLHYYWPQVRIARKHGYKIDNMTEWRDYIDLLRRHNRDTHNPKFVCPASLHEAHNAEVTESERRDRIRQERWRREADERNRREAEEAMKTREQKNKEYVKRMQKYFGLAIPANGFTIVVLQSIDEFEKEGKTLKHCVFTCGYYQHANSLILSARDENNRPIETIEVNLQTFKIAQCYGAHDTFTPMHKAILKAMNDNMWRVKEIRMAS